MSHLFPFPIYCQPLLVRADKGWHGQNGMPFVERFRLPRLWCLHVYSYHARLWANDTEIFIEPGGVSLVPPDTTLVYEFDKRASHFYAHFKLEDVTANATSMRGQFWYSPTLLTPSFGELMEQMTLAHLASQGDKMKEKRAQVALWELLWRLAELAPPPQTEATHPCLRKALSLIETRLDSEIGIANLAREVGLSHNHLTRLFLAHTGKTAVAYIRGRRAERARHLLENSTLSVKSIAAQVGIEDLGAFNHLIRKETGLSPRALRNEAQHEM